MWMPFFFLLVDSWVLSAGAAGVALVLAGCVVSVAAGVASVAAGVASDAGAAFEEFATGWARVVVVPGVTVSTVAVLPDAEPAPRVAVGCGPKERVSSPDSPNGVIVGAPV